MKLALEKDYTVASAREQTSPKSLLDTLRKTVPSAAGLVVTTLPRGDLQVIQPSNVSDGLLKAYARGFHAEDTLSWQTIVRHQPVRLQDAWTDNELSQTAYAHEWLKPQGLTHVVSVPVSSLVLAGYPGVVHLCRTADQGDFTAAELQKLTEAVADHEQRADKSRGKRPGKGGAIERPPVRFSIVDGSLKPKLPPGQWDSLDERLRNQIVEVARRRSGQVNGQSNQADRMLLPDSHGDNWTFRVVTHKRYPALGDGVFNFFCLQPDANEWGVVRPSDLNADQELARLVPALKFMQEHFAAGPTLVDIAKTVQLSPFHFHRRFTELLGLTPKQFLLECQINQAKSDLLAREKELAQIAKDCGFAHQSHFTSRFKQATGLTPTRWRRMATERYQASDN
jgi:AraC-like DNA-binding protein